jgi:hypothetical protein
MNPTQSQPPAAGLLAPLPFKTCIYDLRDANDKIVASFETIEECAHARIAINAHARLLAEKAALVAALQSANKALTRCADEYEAAKMKYRAGFIGEEQLKISAALAAAKET